MFSGSYWENGILVILLVWAVYMVGKTLYNQASIGESEGKCRNCDLNPAKKNKK